MANPGYVRSTDGSDADNGSTWALANATLTGGFTDAAAGDRIYVSDNHAESTAASVTLTSPGTAASPCQVICGDDAAEPPTAVATTGTVTVTGGTVNLEFRGFAYYYGLTFNVGTTGNSSVGFAWNTADPHWTRLDECAINLTTSGVGAKLIIGAASANTDDVRVEWINTDISFANAGQCIVCRASLDWHGGALTAGSAVPTTLFVQANGIGGRVHVRGVDLSLLGSGNSLVSVAPASAILYVFEQCKLGSSVAITTGTHCGPGGPVVLVVNCDSADTNYRYVKVCYQGEITQETTIVRTGGASDGTTSFSRKMATSANAKFYSPLAFGDVGEPLCVWNETVGSSVTVTVEVITDNVTLTDAEAWIEVEYLGTSGFPIASFISDRAADILATPANQTSSSETWTTTGLTTPVKQKLSVSFTPQEKGWIQARVMLAKASTTMYFCPKVDVT